LENRGGSNRLISSRITKRLFAELCKVLETYNDGLEKRNLTHYGLRSLSKSSLIEESPKNSNRVILTDYGRVIWRAEIARLEIEKQTHEKARKLREKRLRRLV